MMRILVWGLMNMIEVYAYWKEIREGEEVKEVGKQSLRQHIDESARALENDIKNTRIWRYYVNINRDNKESAEKWIRAAIVLHDLGKIFYQRNFKFRKNEKYLNFAGHEFISTYLADRFLDAWLEEDIKGRLNEYKDFRWIVCGAILYHHHAMGLKGREQLYEINVCRNENEFNEMVNSIYGIVQNYLAEFGTNAIQGLINGIKELKPTELSKRDELSLDRGLLSDIYRYVDDLNGEIWRKFVEDRRFGKKMILSTNILIMADYRGSEGRGEEKTRFGEMVDESIKLYREISSML
jgi:CRISPR-associated endonuclease Cas3-HD